MVGKITLLVLHLVQTLCWNVWQFNRVATSRAMFLIYPRLLVAGLIVKALGTFPLCVFVYVYVRMREGDRDGERKEGREGV